MSGVEVLKKVRQLKEEAVMAMIDFRLSVPSDRNIMEFLESNKYLVLDMLDDFLTQEVGEYID